VADGADAVEGYGGEEVAGVAISGGVVAIVLVVVLVVLVLVVECESERTGSCGISSVSSGTCCPVG
jgi:hypothetical protein